MIVDRMAKDHLSSAAGQSRLQSVAHEPWSLWVAGNKVTKNLLSTLYEWVHSPLAKEYWRAKNHCEGDILQNVKWDALHTTMIESQHSRRVFITKHAVGMCSVGKFMKRWKERDSDRCPRCDLPKDATHVLICKGAGANEIWDASITELEQWMKSVDTDPEIIDHIVKHLSSWRSSDTPEEYPTTFPPATRQQRMGWDNLLEGWQDSSWEETQQNYYSFLKS
jgi:hypothetical protein